MDAAKTGSPSNIEARRRILIVSGDASLRERVYDVLTCQGYSVTTVCSGKLGFETLQHERPDLILANSASNNCGGWGMADRIRAFDAHLPIILLGHPNEETPDSRTVRDIQDYLPSDVSELALMAVINRWLPKSRPASPIEYPGPILIVDDEPESLRNLEEFLQPRRCTIVKAHCGEEALAQLVKCEPTLVLLDIKMPGMDGLVTLKKLKAARPNLPVIMATAVEDQTLMAQAFMLGAYEYITKPYNLSALEDLLRYLKKFTR